MNTRRQKRKGFFFGGNSAGGRHHRHADGNLYRVADDPVQRGGFSPGWRIPFLLSSVLVLLGLWIRKDINETPDFPESHQRPSGSEGSPARYAETSLA